jgi:hypothetical protein
MRLTVKQSVTRADDLRLAANVRQNLWAHAAVEMDPDNPLHGTHRDEQGRAYFEFSTASSEDVRRILQEQPYAEQIELTEAHETVGEACENCGNIAGPVLPTVCPNCHFRDISPCPNCRQEIPRQCYPRVQGALFQCPHCGQRVRLRFNEPMFHPDGSYNQPLVVVEVAIRHEVR